MPQNFNQIVNAAGVPLGQVQQPADIQGSSLFSEFHGRFYQLAYRGLLYSGGMVLTSIANATFTVATTGATATPIAGVWNPLFSGVSLIVLQATVDLVVTNATSTGCGGFNWMTATNQAAITTGTTPVNRKTLLGTGSQAKDMCGVALTGLTGATVARWGSAINGGNSGNFSFAGTAAGAPTISAGNNVENFDGGLIVPPGGILGLFANTTPAAHSATSSILWAEVLV